MPSDELPVYQLSGSPDEMGQAHGIQAAELLQAGIDSRLKLCREMVPANSIGRTDSEIRSLAEACLPAHEEFCPGLMQELRATADAAGVDATELLIYNGFTDFKDLLYADGDSPGGCTTFAVTRSLSGDAHSWIGQTWDMYRTALPFVCLLKLQPRGYPAALMISLAGCVGMFGFNDAGLAVCTNNLHPDSGTPGVFWPFVMRKLLTCTSVSEAENILAHVQVAGGHNFLVMGAADDRFAEWEILPFVRERLAPRAWTTHTNHCLLARTSARERIDGEIGRLSSEKRQAQASAFLENHLPRITRDDLLALTRLEAPGEEHTVCMRPLPGYDVQTCAAAIMRPATGDMWAARGRPSESSFQHFSLPVKPV